MSLRFPYQPQPLRGPPPPTLPANATAHWRPLIPVRIVCPTTGIFRDFDKALVDTGADDTIFPLAVARSIGVVFLPQPATPFAIRWGGSSFPIHYSKVRLELADEQSAWSWLALIAFSAAPIRYPLLGQAGCLQFMNVTCLGEDRFVLLETNPSYPGTTI